MVRSTDLPRPDSGSGSRWGTSRPLHTPPQFRLPNGHSDRSANASANFAIRTLWCPTSPALWELALHAARFGQTSGYSHQPSCQCDVSVALRAGNCQDPSGRRTQSAPASAGPTTRRPARPSGTGSTPASAGPTSCGRLPGPTSSSYPRAREGGSGSSCGRPYRRSPAPALAGVAPRSSRTSSGPGRRPPRTRGRRPGRPWSCRPCARGDLSRLPGCATPPG